MWFCAAACAAHVYDVGGDGWLWVVIGGYGVSRIGNPVFPMEMVGVMILTVR